ncbi:Peroxin-3 [Lipomyces oligophaga]|uniref:Peroxin-3 n=1 Tax=Lipomyces oligophaga TaxID=45792 RepID=UPI0034CE7A4A
MGFTQFVHRHRRKLALAFGIAAVGYYAYSYARSRILDWHSQFSASLANKENLRRRFEQNQRDATITTTALLSSLADSIMADLPVEQITQELQSKRSGDRGSGEILVTDTVSLSSTSSEPRLATSQPAATKSRSKKALWNDLKVFAITRTFTLLYATALTILLTRIQINILGRKAYMISVLAACQDAESPADLGIDQELETEVNRRFLSSTWWLLNPGKAELLRVIKQSTESIFAEVAPKTEISYLELEQLIYSLRTSIDQSLDSFLAILLPTTDDLYDVVLANNPPPAQPVVSESSVRSELSLFLDESRDIIESPAARAALSASLTSGIQLLLSNIQIGYYFNMYDQESTTSVNDRDPTFTSEASSDSKPVRLANILAGIDRQAREISKYGSNSENPYFYATNNTPELAALCASVYSNYVITHEM